MMTFEFDIFTNDDASDAIWSAAECAVLVRNRVSNMSNIIHDSYDQHQKENGDQHSDSGECKVPEAYLSVLGGCRAIARP